MFRTFLNAWKIPDLRKKLLFTAFILVIFRIGSQVPVPFADLSSGLITDVNAQNFMNYLNMMTGDAFNYGTVFAMSITPYINASIIMQLLGVAIPALERLQKEGEEGQKKITKITRFVAMGLGLLQSTGYYFYIRSAGYLMKDANGIDFTGFSKVLQALVIIIVLSAGTALVMWLGEQINEHGIGNGISLILFAGIIARIPSQVMVLYNTFTTQGGAYYVLVPLVLVIMLGTIAYIIWMDNSERRIPVQYAKRVVGRKMYGGQSSHIPIKVNMSGVMPVIFASSILSLPPTINLFVGAAADSGWGKFFAIFDGTHWVYAIMYFVFIIFFAYFYASIQYNPIEMANNLRRQSGAIPGIRPGRPTSEYIGKILSRVILLGALLLSVVALFPILFSQVTAAFGYPMNIALGGTSVIILVGVALETVEQLESQMMMRHYRGFLD